MKKWMVDSLLERGVFSQQEYDEFMSHYSENEHGELIGGMQVNKLHWKYNLDGDFFERPLLDVVLQDITPPECADSLDPVFAKYGCDGMTGWHWYRTGGLSQIGLDRGRRPIDDASDEELWKIIALSSRYWEAFYRRAYRDEHNTPW